MVQNSNRLYLKLEWKVSSLIESTKDVNEVLAEKLEESLLLQSPHTEQLSEPPISSNQRRHTDFDSQLLRKIEEFEWSVRSRNCLENAKIVYLGDLVVKSEAKLLRIQNFGRKSLNEIKGVLADLGLQVGMNLTNWPPGNIDELSDKCAASTTATDSQSSQLLDHSGQIVRHVSSALSQISLPKLVLRYPLSSRTRNFFANLRSTVEIDEITSLGHYVAQPAMWRAQLFREQNLGRKSIDEIQTFISGWLISAYGAAGLRNHEIEWITKSILGQWSNSNDEIKYENILKKIQSFDFEHYASSMPDAASSLQFLGTHVDESFATSKKIHVVLNSILSERGSDVVSRRFGLSTSKETLEKIATGYGITRERIRQIEAKSLRTCNLHFHKVIFQKFLSESKADIQNVLFRDGHLLTKNVLELTSKDLSGAQILLITIVEGSLGDWLSKNFYPVKKSGQIVAWAVSIGIASEFDEVLTSAQAMESISSRIKKAIEGGVWPMPLRYLEAGMRDIPPALIRKTLVDELNAKIEIDKVVIMAGLPAKIRLIIVLRMAGKELTGAEIVGHHKALFNSEISESFARNCLANLDEALIVGRGKYNLYENLQFPENELVDIRGQVFNYLKELEQYVSSKKIYTDLFLNQIEKFSDQLTDYMLLGILQDDCRFDVRRGLMVGLSDSTFKGKFNFLADEVWNLVSEQGPLSAPEIKRLLSMTRDVLDTTILISLQNMEDIVADKNGYYDLAIRVIGNAKEFDKIRIAIRVNLRAGPLSLFALKNRLVLVGINIPKPTLRSIVMSDSQLEYVGKLASIGDNPCSNLAEYDEIVSSEIMHGASMEEIKNMLRKGASHLLEYIKLDAYMLPSQERQLQNEKDFLGEIIGEFKF